MTTRADLLAAVAAAEHRATVARALVDGWRARGVPTGGLAVTKAEATLAAAREALAQYDRAD